MKEQNYKNHKRLLFGYHGIAFTLCLVLFISSIFNLYIAIKKHTDIRIAIMFLITSVSLIMLFFYARIFSLKAQDRAIRSEENFRYYLLTGKVFDPKLSLSQILALRFSSTEELKNLTDKALTENLSNDEIKKNIRNWRSDTNRV